MIVLKYFLFVRMPLQIVALQENKVRTAGRVVARGGADLNHSAHLVSVANSALNGARPVECVAAASDGIIRVEKAKQWQEEGYNYNCP